MRQRCSEGRAPLFYLWRSADKNFRATQAILATLESAGAVSRLRTIPTNEKARPQDRA